jgi:hypothetical protein
MDVGTVLTFASGVVLGLVLLRLADRLRRYQQRKFNRAILEERLYEMRNGRKKQDLTVPREMIS